MVVLVGIDIYDLAAKQTIVVGSVERGRAQVLAPSTPQRKSARQRRGALSHWARTVLAVGLLYWFCSQRVVLTDID
jgi:hypothetical protein